jgi:hypothetical protein
MPQQRLTPQQDRPPLRSAYRNTRAQADDSLGMRVIFTGTGGGQCHLRDATNIAATSSLRYECMPATLGGRIADRTRARSQSCRVYRTTPPELGREQSSLGLGWRLQVALLLAVETSG